MIWLIFAGVLVWAALAWFVVTAFQRIHNLDERLRRHDQRWLIRRLLADVYHPEGVAIWMRHPHGTFGGLSAEQMIDQDRTDEVLAEVDRLRSGAFG